MKKFVKYIDKFTVQDAPINYKNVSNFNLNEQLMLEEGYLPLEIYPTNEVIEFPVYEYTLYEDKVVGKLINKEPSVKEYKNKILEKAKNGYENVSNKQKIYIGDISFDKDLYTVEYLTAMILAGEEYYLTSLNGEQHLLNNEQIKKFLSDKLFIENKQKHYYENLCNEINSISSISHLKNINVDTYPLNYFKINELHENIRQENILNDGTGYFNDVINIGAFFSEETRVYYGNSGINGTEYLQEHNIPFIKLSYPIAGTIVGLKGDLNLSINCTRLISDQIMNSIKDTIIDFGANASIKNNDILIDGKKFCGAVGFFKINEADDYYKMYIHLSFNLDRELIKRVAIKPQLKELIGLNEIFPELSREKFLNLWIKKLNNLGYRSA